LNLLTLFVIPVGGIALLVLLARLLGFNTQPRLASVEQAGDIARDALIGFHATSAALGDDARAALVASTDGRVALVRPHGDRWIVRIANGAAVKRDGDTLTLALHEPMFPALTLRLADAATWETRLAA